MQNSMGVDNSVTKEKPMPTGGDDVAVELNSGDACSGENVEISGVSLGWMAVLVCCQDLLEDC